MLQDSKGRRSTSSAIQLWEDFLALVMLALKQAWALLLNLHVYVADVCYKLVIYFKILPDSLNEATMKHQMTSISDYIIVCLLKITRTWGIKGLGLKGNA